MAGLIGLARQGFFKPGERVLFLHTGGLPSLHAYEARCWARPAWHPEAFPGHRGPHPGCRVVRARIAARMRPLEPSDMAPGGQGQGHNSPMAMHVV
jgi:hypothetical protein